MDLDRFRPEQLVFCAGAHSQPDRLKALAAGVREAGLEPVIVMEFKDDQADALDPGVDEAALDYVKSERLFGRCRLAVFDMTVQIGQMMEMTMAEQAGTPFFFGFISHDPLARPHGSRMPRGAAVLAGTKPRACRNNDELRAEVRDWCMAQMPELAAATGVNFVSMRGRATSPLQGSNLIGGGSAMPSSIARPLDSFEQPAPIPSGSNVYIEPDDLVMDKPFDFVPGDDEDPSL